MLSNLRFWGFVEESYEYCTWCSADLAYSTPSVCIMVLRYIRVAALSPNAYVSMMTTSPSRVPLMIPIPFQMGVMV